MLVLRLERSGQTPHGPPHRFNNPALRPRSMFPRLETMTFLAAGLADIWAIIGNLHLIGLWVSKAMGPGQIELLQPPASPAARSAALDSRDP
jgi:hypothetical protein